MKKLLIVLCAVGLTLVASAQPKIGGGLKGGAIRGGGVYVKPRVTVIAPYTYVRPYYGFGYGYNRFSPFYDPFYRYPRFESRPTELDLQIEDIKNDFQYQISSLKHDKSLAKDVRKQKMRDLKHQREDAIIEAKKNYYKAKDNDKTS